MKLSQTESRWKKNLPCSGGGCKKATRGGEGASVNGQNRGLLPLPGCAAAAGAGMAQLIPACLLLAGIRVGRGVSVWGGNGDPSPAE